MIPVHETMTHALVRTNHCTSEMRSRTCSVVAGHRRLVLTNVLAASQREDGHRHTDNRLDFSGQARG
jgi:hypothetical protein